MTLNTPGLIKRIGYVILLLFVLAGVWFYISQKSAITSQARERLEYIALSKIDNIVAWRKERIADGMVMMDRKFLISRINDVIENSDPSKLSEIQDELSSYRQHYQYDNIILVKPTGEVLANLVGGAVFHSGFSATLDASVKLRKPLFTPLHREGEDQPPHITIVVPLFTEENKEVRLLCALLLVCNADRFLYPLIQSWPLPSESAETLIVCREGEHALFLNNLRHQKDAALKLKIPLTETNVPAVKAVLGQEGIFDGMDYRGVRVLSVIHPIPDSNWYMISKVDYREVFAAWRYNVTIMLASLFLMLIIAILLGYSAVVRSEKYYYKNLYQSESNLRHSIERHSVTLKAIGDAVIATDADGSIELLNPVAEKLTGWSNADALGRHLDEVFVIINEETRKSVESPVFQVLRKGIVVGLANHTLLISRNGGERPIADSGAPIKDENGNIIGVVLIFRDQTEERNAEIRLTEAANHFRQLFDSAPIPLGLTKRNGVITLANKHFIDLLGYTQDDIKTLDEWWLHAYPDPEYRKWVMMDWENATKSAREANTCIAPREYRIRCKDNVEKYVLVSGSFIGESLLVSFFEITDRKRAEEEREKLQMQLVQAQKMESVGRLAGGVAHDFNNMLGVIIGRTDLLLEKVSGVEPLERHILEVQKAAKRSAELTRQLLAFARKQTIAPKIISLNDVISSMLTMLKRLIGEDIDLLWKPKADLFAVKMDPSQIDQLLVNLIVNARDAIASHGKITIETQNAVIDEQYCSEHIEFLPGSFAVLAVSDNGCGISADAQKHLYEPFYTTKDVGKGTGLGLATVYGIVKQNNGFINVYSEVGQGTTFRIYLPCIEESPVSILDVKTTPIPRGNGEQILVVEDESTMLDLTLNMLINLGYNATKAASPRDAIDFAKTAEVIHLLVTDVVMPEMNGRDLVCAIRELFPNLKCVFMSGYTANVIAHHGVLEEGINFLQKPFSQQELATKVREALCGKG